MQPDLAMDTTQYYVLLHGEVKRYFEFVRLPSFERTAAGVLSEEDIRCLEQVLIENPRGGQVVPGTGGVRKIRVATEGRGKRGSARVIYLYVELREKVYLLLAYAKNVQADLTAEQARAVRALVDQLRKEA
jgi:hypothetical protein